MSNTLAANAINHGTIAALGSGAYGCIHGTVIANTTNAWLTNKAQGLVGFGCGFKKSLGENIYAGCECTRCAAKQDRLR